MFDRLKKAKEAIERFENNDKVKGLAKGAGDYLDSYPDRMKELKRHDDETKRRLKRMGF